MKGGSEGPSGASVGDHYFTVRCSCQNSGVARLWVWAGRADKVEVKFTSWQLRKKKSGWGGGGGRGGRGGGGCKKTAWGGWSRGVGFRSGGGGGGPV